MPFDGTDLTATQIPASPALVPAPLGLRARLARSWRVCLPRGLHSRELRSPLSPPGQGDPGGEAETARLLRVARLLIEPEAAWVQRTYRTEDGKQHCTVGALREAAAWGRYGRRVQRQAHGTLLALALERGFDSVERMNDASSHAEVLAAFDAAIASAGGCLPVAG